MSIIDAYKWSRLKWEMWKHAKAPSRHNPDLALEYRSIIGLAALR